MHSVFLKNTIKFAPIFKTQNILLDMYLLTISFFVFFYYIKLCYFKEKTPCPTLLMLQLFALLV